MSQTTLTQSIAPRDDESPETDRSTFNYRPVPLAAPVTLFLGVCSIFGLYAYVGLGFGLFGTLLGAICLVRIRQSGGALGGSWFAGIGGLISLVMLLGGSVLHYNTYVNEVPDGFRRINFSHDISRKGFIKTKRRMEIPPEVKALDKQRIFVKGFMFPEETMTGITKFLLLKDSKQCCFGGNPAANDMIVIKMKKGMKVDYKKGLVSVAGVFRTRSSTGPDNLKAVYMLEASYFDKAHTNF